MNYIERSRDNSTLGMLGPGAGVRRPVDRIPSVTVSAVSTRQFHADSIATLAGQPKFYVERHASSSMSNHLIRDEPRRKVSKVESEQTYPTGGNFSEGRHFNKTNSTHDRRDNLTHDRSYHGYNESIHHQLGSSFSTHQNVPTVSDRNIETLQKRNILRESNTDDCKLGYDDQSSISNSSVTFDRARLLGDNTKRNKIDKDSKHLSVDAKNSGFSGAKSLAPFARWEIEEKRHTRMDNIPTRDRAERMEASNVNHEDRDSSSQNRSSSKDQYLHNSIHSKSSNVKLGACNSKQFCDSGKSREDSAITGRQNKFDYSAKANIERKEDALKSKLDGGTSCSDVILDVTQSETSFNNSGGDQTRLMSRKSSKMLRKLKNGNKDKGGLARIRQVIIEQRQRLGYTDNGDLENVKANRNRDITKTKTGSFLSDDRALSQKLDSMMPTDINRPVVRRADNALSADKISSRSVTQQNNTDDEEEDNEIEINVRVYHKNSDTVKVSSAAGASKKKTSKIIPRKIANGPAAPVYKGFSEVDRGNNQIVSTAAIVPPPAVTAVSSASTAAASCGDVPPASGQLPSSRSVTSQASTSHSVTQTSSRSAVNDATEKIQPGKKNSVITTRSWREGQKAIQETLDSASSTMTGRTDKKISANSTVNKPPRIISKATSENRNSANVKNAESAVRSISSNSASDVIVVSNVSSKLNLPMTRGFDTTEDEDMWKDSNYIRFSEPNVKNMDSKLSAPLENNKNGPSIQFDSADKKSLFKYNDKSDNNKEIIDYAKDDRPRGVTTSLENSTERPLRQSTTLQTNKDDRLRGVTTSLENSTGRPLSQSTTLQTNKDDRLRGVTTSLENSTGRPLRQSTTLQANNDDRLRGVTTSLENSTGRQLGQSTTLQTSNTQINDVSSTTGDFSTSSPDVSVGTEVTRVAGAGNIAQSPIVKTRNDSAAILAGEKRTYSNALSSVKKTKIINSPLRNADKKITAVVKPVQSSVFTEAEREAVREYMKRQRAERKNKEQEARAEQLRARDANKRNLDDLFKRQRSLNTRSGTGTVSQRSSGEQSASKRRMEESGSDVMDDRERIVEGSAHPPANSATTNPHVTYGNDFSFISHSVQAVSSASVLRSDSVSSGKGVTSSIPANSRVTSSHASALPSDLSVGRRYDDTVDTVRERNVTSNISAADRLRSLQQMAESLKSKISRATYEIRPTAHEMSDQDNALNDMQTSQVSRARRELYISRGTSFHSTDLDRNTVKPFDMLPSDSKTESRASAAGKQSSLLTGARTVYKGPEQDRLAGSSIIHDTSDIELISPLKSDLGSNVTRPIDSNITMTRGSSQPKPQLSHQSTHDRNYPSTTARSSKAATNTAGPKKPELDVQHGDGLVMSSVGKGKSNERGEGNGENQKDRVQTILSKAGTEIDTSLTEDPGKVTPDIPSSFSRNEANVKRGNDDKESISGKTQDKVASNVSEHDVDRRYSDLFDSLLTADISSTSAPRKSMEPVTSANMTHFNRLLQLSLTANKLRERTVAATSLIERVASPVNVGGAVKQSSAARDERSAGEARKRKSETPFGNTGDSSTLTNGNTSEEAHSKDKESYVTADDVVKSLHCVLPSHGQCKKLRRDGSLKNLSEASSVASTDDAASLRERRKSKFDWKTYEQFSVDLLKSYFTEPKTRVKHQQTVLKSRERALLDQMRSELMWLDKQGRQTPSRGADEQYPLAAQSSRRTDLIKSNERHQAGLKILQEFAQQALELRQTSMMDDDDQALIETSAQQLADKLRESGVELNDLTDVFIDMLTGGNEATYSGSTSKERHADTVVSQAGDTSSVGGDSVSMGGDSVSLGGDSMASEPISISSPSVISEKLKKKLDKKFLTVREQGLRERRQKAEELLAWKLRLDEEEREIVRLEREAAEVARLREKSQSASSGFINHKTAPQNLEESLTRTTSTPKDKGPQRVSDDECRRKERRLSESGTDSETGVAGAVKQTFSEHDSENEILQRRVSDIYEHDGLQRRVSGADTEEHDERPRRVSDTNEHDLLQHGVSGADAEEHDVRPRRVSDGGTDSADDGSATIKTSALSSDGEELSDKSLPSTASKSTASKTRIERASAVKSQLASDEKELREDMSNASNVTNGGGDGKPVPDENGGESEVATPRMPEETEWGMSAAGKRDDGRKSPLSWDNGSNESISSSVRVDEVDIARSPAKSEDIRMEKKDGSKSEIRAMSDDENDKSDKKVLTRDEAIHPTIKMKQTDPVLEDLRSRSPEAVSHSSEKHSVAAVEREVKSDSRMRDSSVAEEIETEEEMSEMLSERTSKGSDDLKQTAINCKTAQSLLDSQLANENFQSDQQKLSAESDLRTDQEKPQDLVLYGEEEEDDEHGPQKRDDSDTAESVSEEIAEEINSAEISCESFKQLDLMATQQLKANLEDIISRAAVEIVAIDVKEKNGAQKFLQENEPTKGRESYMLDRYIKSKDDLGIGSSSKQVICRDYENGQGYAAAASAAQSLLTEAVVEMVAIRKQKRERSKTPERSIRSPAGVVENSVELEESLVSPGGSTQSDRLKRLMRFISTSDEEIDVEQKERSGTGFVAAGDTSDPVKAENITNPSTSGQKNSSYGAITFLSTNSRKESLNGASTDDQVANQKQDDNNSLLLSEGLLDETQDPIAVRGTVVEDRRGGSERKPHPLDSPGSDGEAVFSPTSDEGWFDDDLGFGLTSSNKKPAISPPLSPSDVTGKSSFDLDHFIALPTGRVSVEEESTSSASVKSFVPVSPEELEPLVTRAVEILWELRRYGESWNDAKPPEHFLCMTSENEKEDHDISCSDNKETSVGSSRRCFNRLIFDLVTEILFDVYSDEEEVERDVPDCLRPPPRRPAFERGSIYKQPPTDALTLSLLVKSLVSSCVGQLGQCERNELEPRGGMKWSGSGGGGKKTKDPVDRLLMQELRREEPSWVDYERDTLDVKNHLADTLCDMLLTETVQLLAKISDR